MNWLQAGEVIAAHLRTQLLASPAGEPEVHMIVEPKQHDDIRSSNPESFNGVFIKLDSSTITTQGDSISVTQRWSTFIAVWGAPMAPDGLTHPEGELAGQVWKAMRKFQPKQTNPADPEELKLSRFKPAINQPGPVEIAGYTYLEMLWETSWQDC